MNRRSGEAGDRDELAAARATIGRLEALLSHTSDVITVLDAAGRIRYTNAAAPRLTGHRREELDGTNPFELIHPEDRAEVLEAFTGHLREPGLSAEIRFRLRFADGSWHHVAVRANNRLDDETVRGIVVTLHDNTELHEALRSLEESEQRHRSVVNALEEGVMLYGSDGTVQAANPAAERLIGRPAGGIVGTRTADAAAGPDNATILRADGSPMSRGEFPTAHTLATGEPRSRVVVGLRRGEDTRWLSVNTRALGPMGDDGRPSAVVASFTDITEMRTAEERLRRSEQRFRSLVQKSIDAVLVCDADGAIRYASPPAARMLERPIDELVGTDLAALVRTEDLPVVSGAFRAALNRSDEQSPVEFRRGTGSSPPQYLEGVFTNLLDDPAVEGIVVNVHDVTERRRAADQLAHQALHDPLTGLPNRTLFMDRLAHSLRRLRRDGGRLAVLFADVDRFKVINDSLGHDAGDRVLAALAERIQGVLRPGDTVARFGGDEFVMLCEAVTEAEARSVAERLTRVASPPVVIPGPLEGPRQQAGPAPHELFVSTSVGIALTDDPGCSPESLLANADAAMYRAKELGRARCAVFDETLHSWAVARLDTERALRHGLDQGEFALALQPIVRLADGRVTGAEALLRWRHPERGVVAPAEFVPVAEETGLIIPLGTWVLREACRLAARWPRPAAERAPAVSVNISARQLAEPGLAALVESALADAALDGGQLSLEITESVLMGDVTSTIHALDALKALGVAICVDDFGTGYSSLAYLRRFPVDALKVDRSFVDGLGKESEDSAIVAAVVGLARSLGLEAIAEGVETAEQVAELVRIGCSHAQGFHLGRPMAADRLEALLTGEPTM